MMSREQIDDNGDFCYFRLDEDQSARKNAQKYLKVVDPDYFELEGTFV